MDEDREGQVRGALGKGLLALVAIAVAIALGTFLMVRALGLGDSDGTAAGAPSSSAPLPTTALEVPEDEQPSASSSPAASASPSDEPSGGLTLDVSPLQVGPGQRINMTGSYPGGNATLQIQRFEGGTWTDFPVTAEVTAGTFQTYIQTSRTGEQRFRLLDPQTQVASNEVAVTVG